MARRVVVWHWCEPGCVHLTAGDVRMIRLVADGGTNTQLAARLGVTTAAIRHGLSRMYRRLQVQSRVELVALAFQQRLLR